MKKNTVLIVFVLILTVAQLALTGYFYYSFGLGGYGSSSSEIETLKTTVADLQKEIDALRTETTPTEETTTAKVVADLNSPTPVLYNKNSINVTLVSTQYNAATNMLDITVNVQNESDGTVYLSLQNVMIDAVSTTSEGSFSVESKNSSEVTFQAAFQPIIDAGAATWNQLDFTLNLSSSEDATNANIASVPVEILADLFY